MSGGEQIRDYVNVETVVWAFLEECKRTIDRGHWNIRNLGAGQPRSLKDFAAEWWAHWGALGKLEFGKLPYRKNEVMRYVPKIDELEC